MKVTENELARNVYMLGFKIHKALGPGLLESTYEECLYFELLNSGIRVEKQKALPLIYQDVKLEIGYRVDLLVENKLIVELKAVENVNELHLAQLLTYLRLSGCKLGLLINFNSTLFKQGVRRVINGNLQSL